MEHGFRAEGEAKGIEKGIVKGRDIGLNDAMQIMQAYRDGTPIPAIAEKFQFEPAKIESLLQSAGLLEG